MILHLALILLSAQDPQWNCENPQAQQEMNFCAAQDYRRADAELSTAYRAAIESARQADREYAGLADGAGGPDTGPGEEATLREAQRAWVSFREADCRLESFEARGGTMQPLIDATCRASRTRARTAELRGPECPGEPPQAEINACLDRQFARADAALGRQWLEALTAQADGAEQLRTAQRAWLAYRDAHCESIVPSVASAEIQTSARLLCRTRMTEARTHELAELAGTGE
ncbi:MAG TPA: lysozyme inhibitor LprI family protein [Allosphingosinicella sp.]|nr:lysozyme inhibitor LprI family protein [Allosphingosinicella sp.]